MRPLVPAGLEIDTFEGVTWLGLVPFRMQDVMLRYMPALPWVSAFPELNVRLYVTHRGRPGVWFISLDATNPLAVWAARRFFHLPYHRAVMSVTSRDDTIDYRSRRVSDGCELDCSYRPVSAVYHAKAGTLEHWLTERYCLYSQSPDGSLWTNDVHHLPWPLQKAEATFRHQTMLAAPGVKGLEVQGQPLLHFAKRIDTVIWASRQVEAADSQM